MFNFFMREGNLANKASIGPDDYKLVVSNCCRPGINPFFSNRSSGTVPNGHTKGTIYRTHHIPRNDIATAKIFRSLSHSPARSLNHDSLTFRWFVTNSSELVVHLDNVETNIADSFLCEFIDGRRDCPHQQMFWSGTSDIRESCSFLC